MKTRYGFVSNSSSSSFIIAQKGGIKKVKNLFNNTEWEKITVEKLRQWFQTKMYWEYEQYFSPGHIDKWCWSGAHTDRLNDIVYVEDSIFLDSIKTGTIDSRVPESLKTKKVQKTKEDKTIKDTLENVLESHRAKILVEENKKNHDKKYAYDQFARELLIDCVCDFIFENVEFGDIYEFEADDHTYVEDSDDQTLESMAYDNFESVKCDFKMSVSCH